VHFDLVDRVVELSPTRVVTLKHVTAAEEYLQDHFPTYPVLPGVMMLEAMVQAARRLAAHAGMGERLVLASVRALKYGQFVRPGSSLRVEVDLAAPPESLDFKGRALLIDPARPGESPVAVSGRFMLRPHSITEPTGFTPAPTV
jgi:3-hydroxyacyl-[acyl-carrier-protein] dehydratase